MDVTAIVAVCLFTIIFTVGVPGNCLVLWVFARKSRKTTTSLLILSLATIDLCACLIAPIHLVRALGGLFINALVCRFSIYGSRAFSFSSLYLTTCIALDRYMAVCRPLQTRTKTRRVIAVILVSIGLAVSANFQYALYVKLFQIGTVAKCIYQGGPDWLDLSNEIFTSVSYLVALMICTCVYVRIYREIRKQMKVRAGLAGNEIQAAHIAGRPGNCFTISKFQGYHRTAEDNGAKVGKANKCVLPEEKATTAGHPESHAMTTSRGCSDLLGDGWIGSGTTTNCNSQTKPSKIGSNYFLDSKLPTFVPPPEAPSADHLSYPCSSAQDNTSGPARKDAGHQPTHRNRQKKERIMTRMLLGTNLILILSWLPSFILTNVPDEAVAAYRGKASQGIVVSFSYQLRTLNHIVSIFVYALLNANFRKDCKAIFVKCKLLRNR